MVNSIDLTLLFDEERILEDEEQSRPADPETDGHDGIITWKDSRFRRVRLFKADAVFKRNRDSRGGNQTMPLYVLIEDSYDWIGEDPKWPKEKQRRRTYVTGPDSKRIRQAAAIAEAYGGKINYYAAR